MLYLKYKTYYLKRQSTCVLSSFEITPEKVILMINMIYGIYKKEHHPYQDTEPNFVPGKHF